MGEVSDSKPELSVRELQNCISKLVEAIDEQNETISTLVEISSRQQDMIKDLYEKLAKPELN